MTALLRALEARSAAGDPIRVGLVGAGYAGRGFAARVLRRTPGIELVAVCNRTIGEAERAYRDAGVNSPGHVGSAAALDVAIRNHRPVITDDPTVLTDAAGIEAIVEATGEVEFGAGVAVYAYKGFYLAVSDFFDQSSQTRARGFLGFRRHRILEV